MNDISKDKDYQEFFAGIKELAKGLMQIRERAAIEYAPIVEEFCARKHATANEVGRMLDYLFEFADDERILLMYKKVCRRFVYEYPDTISYYIMEYRKEYDRESLIGTEYEYLLHEDDEFEAYFPGGEGFVYKKMPGAEGNKNKKSQLNS